MGSCRLLLRILHDVTSLKGLPANLEQGWQFRNGLHIEQLSSEPRFCSPRRSLRDR
jgi:hypothetical protein